MGKRQERQSNVLENGKATKANRERSAAIRRRKMSQSERRPHAAVVAGRGRRKDGSADTRKRSRPFRSVSVAISPRPLAAADSS